MHSIIFNPCIFNFFINMQQVSFVILDKYSFRFTDSKFFFLPEHSLAFSKLFFLWTSKHSNVLQLAEHACQVYSTSGTSALVDDSCQTAASFKVFSVAINNFKRLSNVSLKLLKLFCIYIKDVSN